MKDGASAVAVVISFAEKPLWINNNWRSENVACIMAVFDGFLQNTLSDWQLVQCK